MGIVHFWSEISLFIDKWETLFGAFIGASLPILVAVLWNPVKTNLNKYVSLKESLREIEIDTSQIINDIIEIESIYLDFIRNIRRQVEIAKRDSNAGTLLFNAPPKIYIYENQTLIKHRTGSPYLHNILLDLSRWTRQTNALLDNIIESTTNIQQSFSDRFHSLPIPISLKIFSEIRDNYHVELLRFCDQIDNVSGQSFKNGLEVAVAVKICGSKINNWNRSFIYSNLLKKFDSDYRTFSEIETSPKNYRKAELYAAIESLIQVEINNLITEIRK